MRTKTYFGPTRQQSIRARQPGSLRSGETTPGEQLHIAPANKPIFLVRPSKGKIPTTRSSRHFESVFELPEASHTSLIPCPCETPWARWSITCSSPRNNRWPTTSWAASFASTETAGASLKTSPQGRPQVSTHSKIEWTDATWNPVTGCTKVSPGCKYCYALTFAERFRGTPGHPFEQGFDLRLWPQRLGLPLAWKRPKRIFVNSMSDLFHERIPFPFIDRVFITMARAKWHEFQVLTKRPERLTEYARRRCDWFASLAQRCPHIWL